jgi:hypothetical protein
MIAQDHDVAISETLATARAIFGISPRTFDTRAVIPVLIKSDHPNISTRPPPARANTMQEPLKLNAGDQSRWEEVRAMDPGTAGNQAHRGTLRGNNLQFGAG